LLRSYVHCLSFHTGHRLIVYNRPAHLSRSFGSH
jgi:hypothetical protein